MSSRMQDLMRPKSAMFYIGALEDIADDFVEFVRKDVRGSDDGLTNRFALQLMLRVQGDPSGQQLHPADI